MTNNIHILGKSIIENHSSLIENATNLRLEANKEVLPPYMMSSYAELITLIGETLINQNQTQSLVDVRNWAKKISKMAINDQIEMRIMLEYVYLIRQLFFELIQTEANQHPQLVEDSFTITQFIHPLLDESVMVISSNYHLFNKEILDSAKQSIKALSAPVIPVTDDIGVLPILAEFTSYRAQIIMEKVLTRVTELGLNYLIIDLSGLTKMDINDANRLYEIVQTLKLLGIDPMITGIQPNVAQTMVNLDITITNVPVMGTMQQALQTLGIRTS